MRHFALLAILLPTPVLADQILTGSHITAVTIYPQGAQVTREVTFTAPVGSHELLITDLPEETQPDLIRLQSDSLQLGAFSLRTDRLPAQDDTTDPDYLAAKAALETARAAEREAQAGVDAINARVEAAEAQAAFLRAVKPEGDAVTVDAVKALSSLIGSETLAARQAALAAQKDLPPAQKALEDAQKVVIDTQATMEMYSAGPADFTGLSVAFTAASAGEAHLTVQHYVQSANWQPVYDLLLARKDPSLTIARGVLVTQYTGEDWKDVTLTLSTAQPSAQAQPSALWPDLRRVIDEDQARREAEIMASGDSAAMEPAVMAEPAPVVVASAAFEGDVVVYHYPTPVNVATGVENLRLALDEIKVTPKIVARAVPRYDSTAFVMASFTNESKEILLPGTAYLMREGTLVGSTELAAIAPGDKADIAFGAIDGLRLHRDMPQRSEGDSGIIMTTTSLEEKSVLRLENLTDEAWPVRLMDVVPYSEQDDLEASYTADPAPTEADVDGQRGILAWEFDMAPGEKKEVALTSTLSWPEGKELQ